MNETNLKKFFIFLIIILSIPLFTTPTVAQVSSKRAVYLKQLQQKEALEKQKYQNRIIAQENMLKNFLYGSFAQEIRYYDYNAGVFKDGLAILKIKPYSSNAISVDIISDNLKITDIIMPFTLYKTRYAQGDLLKGFLITDFRAEHIKKETRKNITEYNSPVTGSKFTKVDEKEITISDIVITSNLLKSPDGSGYFKVSLVKVDTPEINKVFNRNYINFIDDYLLGDNFRKLNENSDGYSSFFGGDGSYMTFKKDAEIYLKQEGKKKNSDAVSSQKLTSINLASLPEPKVEFSEAFISDSLNSYIQQLNLKIKGNWHPPQGSESTHIVVILKISKDGNLLNSIISSSSGIPEADYAALNTIKMSAPFNPLPTDYKGNDVDIQYTFDRKVRE